LKRALICVIVIAMMFAVVGCGYIGGEKAISIALAEQGIDRIGAASTKADLNKTDDPATYKVELNLNSHIVNYYIDATTGEIISKEDLPN